MAPEQGPARLHLLGILLHPCFLVNRLLIMFLIQPGGEEILDVGLIEFRSSQLPIPLFSRKVKPLLSRLLSMSVPDEDDIASLLKWFCVNVAGASSVSPASFFWMGRCKDVVPQMEREMTNLTCWDRRVDGAAILDPCKARIGISRTSISRGCNRIIVLLIKLKDNFEDDICNNQSLFIVRKCCSIMIAYVNVFPDKRLCTPEGVLSP